MNRAAFAPTAEDATAARPSPFFIPAPLTAPRHFVGSIDATRDRTTPTPRTLEQCRGMQRSSWAVVRSAADPAPAFTAGDRAVAWACALGGAAVALLLIVETVNGGPL